MKRIYTFGGFPATRNLTVADIKAGKGQRKFVQTTAVNRVEAAAAEAAGIDHLSIVDHDLHDVRAGAPNTFTTAALMASDYETHEDILRAGLRAAAAGADALYTLRSFKAVEMLADEGLAVQGHLGLVPRLSTQIGACVPMGAPPMRR
jgi:3-methyl-2-oxobutanoate hydroxymethyltransferase